MNKYNFPKSARHRNMKMYADLIGNYKKYRIKSLYDNICVVEFGTGLYAKNGDGRQTPWKYKTPDGKWHTTSGQSAQPFLTPALLENKDSIERVIQEEVNKCLTQGKR